MNSERIAEELIGIAEDVVEASCQRGSSLIEGATSLDGMSKTTAKRNVNKLLSRYVKGFFSDDYWRPVQNIFKAMDAAVINWELESTLYRKDNDGNPISKEWKFVVYFENNRGKPNKMYGIIVASGVGASDPLSRYDVVAYIG